MKAPSIFARLILPSVLVAAALVVFFGVRERWILAAWSTCSLALALAAARWLW